MPKSVFGLIGLRSTARVYDAERAGVERIRRERERMGDRLNIRVARWYDRLSLWRAIGTVISVALVLVLVAGLLARLVEPDTFTSIGLANWWAIVTVTTVGYGDVVPHSAGGRVVGSMLMLTGLAFIPTLTSVTVSALLSKRSRADRQRLEQLEAEQAAVLARIEKQLDRIERSE
jgi:voltage-gated potassium channel